MVKLITGDYKVKINVEEKGEKKELVIDFSPPFKKIPMLQGLEERLNVKLPEDLYSQEANDFFCKLVDQHHVNCPAPRTTARLIDKLVGHFIEPECLNPTFIIDHPQVMSPLAKYHRSIPGLTERFELFVNYHEICNAYTELNDPFIQKELFIDQMKVKILYLNRIKHFF